MANSIQQPVLERRNLSPTALTPLWSDAGPGRALGRFGVQPNLVEVEVPTGRLRNYPGLVGPAPRTDLYYRAFARHVSGKSVVDLGCGAGSALVHFREARSVVGVDSDPVALEFARYSLAGVEFAKADLHEQLHLSAEVVSIVDVLGSVRDPRVVLDNARELLGAGGILCLAEPRAQVAQGLLAPVRRAFSKGELSRLLAETGYRVLEWISEGAFLVVVAEVAFSEDVTWFMLGHRLRVARELARAKEAFANVGATSKLHHEALLEIFDINLELGEFEEALTVLMSAERKDGLGAKALVALSTASRLLGEFGDAKQFAETAQEMEPNSAEVAIAYAQALGEDASSGEKLAAWLNAARLAPSDTGVAIGLARAATDAEAYQLGASSLERVRQYHEKLPSDFHLTLGWLYVMVDRLDDALMESRLVALVEPLHPGLGELVGSICAARPRPFGVS